MTGYIKGAQVLGHPIIIIQSYGIRVLAACILAVVLRRHVTFLSIAVHM